MSHRTNSIPNIRTIKALRGESLTIDLGKTLAGTLTAWMKKNPNDATYRSFEILDNRYLILTQAKAKDYYNVDGLLIEEIAGKWYFDVEQVLDPLKPEEVKTIFQGTIIFQNDITNSVGTEMRPPAAIVAQIENETEIPLTGMKSTFTEIRFDDSFPLGIYSLNILCYTEDGAIVTPTFKRSSKTNDGFSLWVDKDCFLDYTAVEVLTESGTRQIETDTELPLSGMSFTDIDIVFSESFSNDYNLSIFCYTESGAIVTPVFKRNSKTSTGFKIWVDVDCFIDYIAMEI